MDRFKLGKRLNCPLPDTRLRYGFKSALSRVGSRPTQRRSFSSHDCDHPLLRQLTLGVLGERISVARGFPLHPYPSPPLGSGDYTLDPTHTQPLLSQSLLGPEGWCGCHSPDVSSTSLRITASFYTRRILSAFGVFDYSTSPHLIVQRLTCDNDLFLRSEGLKKIQQVHTTRLFESSQKTRSKLLKLIF